MTDVAEFYEARDGRDGGRRILKMITNARANPKTDARLAQEAVALAQVDCVHVGRFYDAGIEAGAFWLLREYAEGMTLREKMAPGPLDVKSALRWLRQASDGVAEMHRKRILHRDLKPENILITVDDVVKVTDFGIVKFIGFGIHTTHGQMVGTPAYMAPEQVRNDVIDGRADVYSMSVMLYEALSGSNPMGGPGANVFEVCARQLNYVPPPLTSVVKNDDVTEDLSALVASGLDKDPERRPRTMRELSERLQELLERKLVGQRRAVENAAESAYPSNDARTVRTAPMAAVPDPASPGSRQPGQGSGSSASTSAAPHTGPAADRVATPPPTPTKTPLAATLPLTTADTLGGPASPPTSTAGSAETLRSYAPTLEHASSSGPAPSRPTPTKTPLAATLPLTTAETLGGPASLPTSTAGSAEAMRTHSPTLEHASSFGPATVSTPDLGHAHAPPRRRALLVVLPLALAVTLLGAAASVIWGPSVRVAGSTATASVAPASSPDPSPSAREPEHPPATASPTALPSAPPLAPNSAGVAPRARPRPPKAWAAPRPERNPNRVFDVQP